MDNNKVPLGPGSGVNTHTFERANSSHLPNPSHPQQQYQPSISSPSKDSYMDDKIYQSFKHSFMQQQQQHHSPQKRNPQPKSALMKPPSSLPPTHLMHGRFDENQQYEGYDQQVPMQQQYTQNPPPYIYNNQQHQQQQPYMGFSADDFLMNEPSPVPTGFQMQHQRAPMFGKYQGVRNHMKSNIDPLLGMFDSSNYEDDDDEDYSVQEDLKKNFKRYKDDEEWVERKKFIIPKSEVHDLIQDARKPPPLLGGNDPFSSFGYGSSNNMTGGGGLRKRQQAPIISDPMFQQLYQQNKKFKPNFTANSTPYNALANVSNQANASSDQMQRYNQTGLSSQLIDQMFPNNSNLRQDDKQLHLSQFARNPSNGNMAQASQPNLQNNFYYSFNNNYLGGQNSNLSLGGTGNINSQTNQEQSQGKQVKSIEIQVTPEKLQEKDCEGGLGQAGGVGTANNDELENGKKRRRRRRKVNGENQQDQCTDSSGFKVPQAWPGFHSNQPNAQYYNYPQVQTTYYVQPGVPQRYPQVPYYPQGPSMMPYPGAPFYPPQGNAYQGFQNPGPSGMKLLPGGHTYPPPPSPGMSLYPPPITEDQQKPPQHKALMDQQSIHQPSMRELSRTMLHYPFNNEQLRELVQQIEIYIQMLYQVLLYPGKKNQMQEMEDLKDCLSNKKKLKNSNSLANVANKDPNKYRAYCLLYEFISKKDATLKPLGLPIYKVPLDSIRATPQNNLKKKILQSEEPFVLKMHPQVSFFQSPLLEFASEIIDQMKKQSSTLQLGSLNQQKDQTRQTTKFLKKFQPLINPYLLPINRSIVQEKPKNKGHYSYFKQRKITNQENDPSFDNQDMSGQKAQNNLEEQKKINDDEEDFDDIDKVQQIHQMANSINNNRRKFSLVDDNFLLLGLRQHGYKEVDLIKQNWLPAKQPSEIKHRYKNLTCAKASDNLIKRWKNTHSLPLSDFEMRQLARAVRWFGPSTTNRWPLISKCFLPNRSAHFLKLEYSAIVQDQQKAEKFGRMMLQERSNENSSDEENAEEYEKFEEVDLDYDGNNEKNEVSKQSSQRNMFCDDDEEVFEEASLDIEKCNRREYKIRAKSIQLYREELERKKTDYDEIDL